MAYDVCSTSEVIADASDPALAIFLQRRLLRSKAKPEDYCPGEIGSN
jgi:hypothetical protein